MMQKMQHFLLILFLIQWTNSEIITTDLFFQELKDQFRPIEYGENASFNTIFSIEMNDQSHRVEYEFWTRNQSLHGQWASKLIVYKNVDIHLPFRRYRESKWITRPLVYKSLYTNGTLFINKEVWLPEFQFLKSLLIKGPQIYSLLDRIKAKNGNDEITQDPCGDVTYKKNLDSTVVHIKKFDSDKYLILFEREYFIFHTSYTKVLVHSNLDDQLFQMPNDMKPYLRFKLFGSGLFMGLWDLAGLH